MSEYYQYVVGLDFSRLFDTVNHDILMGLTDKHMEDKDIRRLIYVFLKSGVMINDNMTATALEHLPYQRETGKLGMISPQKKKLKKLEDRIRLITRRTCGVKIETVIIELNCLFRRGIGDFARSSMKQHLERLMEWIKRRIRQYLWKHWKNGSNFY